MSNEHEYLYNEVVLAYTSVLNIYIQNKIFNINVHIRYVSIKYLSIQKLSSQCNMCVIIYIYD